MCIIILVVGCKSFKLAGKKIVVLTDIEKRCVAVISTYVEKLSTATTVHLMFNGC